VLELINIQVPYARFDLLADHGSLRRLTVRGCATSPGDADLDDVGNVYVAQVLYGGLSRLTHLRSFGCKFKPRG
jgi:hypothetical protein